jgi:hypothetical protein
MDNANPVVNENIVSRRHRKDTTKSPEEDGSIFALWASIKAEDHDEGIESTSSASQTDLAAEDDEVDPIDAQEIYGKQVLPRFIFLPIATEVRLTMR